MSILIVDDSDTMRLLLRRELRIAGWEDVEEAPDAATALSVISSSEVSLVLSDWHMPTMSGLDLLHRLRSDSNGTKFGFVTCEASDSQRLHALHAGAEFLITKPFDHEQLSHHIRIALGMKGDDLAGEGDRVERTLQEVLSRLFQRPVTVSPAQPPRRELVRCVADYRHGSTTQETARAVIEMPLAATLACALARIPAREANEWASSHCLTGTVERNLLEVANVLAGVVFPATGHYVLKDADYVDERGVVDREKEKNGWHDCVHVDVTGYPPGRLGTLR